MDLPDDVSLPFFAYGLFRPGQIAYFQIADYVCEIINGSKAKGELRIRDGLPIMDVDGNGTVEGAIISFKEGAAAEAYKRIAGLEPDKQYRWATLTINGAVMNILLGRSPRKGSISLAETDEKDWDGWEDPLFTAALDVVQETIDSNIESKWDLKPLFRLQMAYLLLWSSIERYVSLRYHLAQDATEKVSKLYDEAAFSSAVHEHVSERRHVIRADEPQDKIVLDPNSPKSAVAYYYGVRCNITHRGKGVHRDHETLLKSATELLAIFRAVLERAKMDALA